MKNLQNLGTVLNKAEQRKINGGRRRCYELYPNQPPVYVCRTPCCGSDGFCPDRNHPVIC